MSLVDEDYAGHLASKNDAYEDWLLNLGHRAPDVPGKGCLTWPFRKGMISLRDSALENDIGRVEATLQNGTLVFRLWDTTGKEIPP